MKFTKEGDKYVNKETALEQLETYKLLMDSYVEQNCSITVSYEGAEIKGIVDWLLDNWDHYVGVSFLPKVASAEQAGYAYLPQEVVGEEEYNEYAQHIKEVDLDDAQGIFELEDDECLTGVCPVK